jgi:hypothetical protein
VDTGQKKVVVVSGIVGPGSEKAFPPGPDLSEGQIRPLFEMNSRQQIQQDLPTIRQGSTVFLD